MKYKTTGTKLGGKNSALGIAFKYKLHVNQTPKQINRPLSSLISSWNITIESYYTTKVQIYAKYSQHLPSITSAMAAGSKNRWSHLTFMARNEYHSQFPPPNFRTSDFIFHYSLLISSLSNLWTTTVWLAVLFPG